MVYVRMLSRHQLAQVTREMSERSQHSLQQQFVHIVEPRKFNGAQKKADLKVNLFLFTVYLVRFLVVLSCFDRTEDFLLISVPVVCSGKNFARSWSFFWPPGIFCRLQVEIYLELENRWHLKETYR